jgi:beta-glucanase (GH16 family)
MGKGRRTWLLLVLAAVTACGAVMATPRAADGSGTPERPAAASSGTSAATATAGSQTSAATATAGSRTPEPTWAPDAGYRLIFDDEFNGTKLGSDWTPGWLGTGITGPVNSMENAAYSSANVSEKGGTLNLTLARSPVTSGRGTFPYTGALVTTRGHFTFTYGYVEWRAYLPKSAGGLVADWPALWADGTGTWPSTGEMDVMEGLDGNAVGHFISTSGTDRVGPTGPMYGWHTFGAAWQEGMVTYYYDGQQVGAITKDITGDPMFLVMDNTISGTSPSASSFPAVMRLDWVRVWS